MAHTHIETQLQTLVGSKDGVDIFGWTYGQTNIRTDRQMDGEMDATDCLTFQASAVGINMCTR